MLSVVIIKFIGIGLGSVYWNTTGEIISWATARFGLFGVNAEIPHMPNVNYVGVTLTVISIFVFFFVKTEDIAIMNQKQSRVTDDFLSVNTREAEVKLSRIDLWLNGFSEGTKKIIGISMAVFAGVIFGMQKTIELKFF